MNSKIGTPSPLHERKHKQAFKECPICHKPRVKGTDHSACVDKMVELAKQPNLVYGGQRRSENSIIRQKSALKKHAYEDDVAYDFFHSIGIL